MDDKFKEKLNIIFEDYKQKYQSVYEKSGNIQSQQNNGNNFSPIFEKMSDTLIDRANKHIEKNGAKSKTEIENHIKKLISDFQSLMVNPN